VNWESNGQIFTNVAVVYKVNEEFGGLSNMHNGYPLRLGSLTIRSSEALYQACRYPHRPDWQREILAAPHAMRAKMSAKKEGRRSDSRPDWDAVRVEIMRWTLGVKLDQHFGKFYGLLRRTGQLQIVERSRRDQFWGAVLGKDDVLHGTNMLGRLLAQIRDETNGWLAKEEDDEAWGGAKTPAIKDFLLLGRPIAALLES
jgi:type I restriction enzyme S subunit